MIMKVTPIMELLTTSKKLEKRQKKLEIQRKIETVHTTVVLRLVRILRRVLESRGDFGWPLLHFKTWIMKTSDPILKPSTETC